MSFYCLECNCNIQRQVSEYSLDNFGVPLCISHQRWIERQEENSTFEAISLYFALKERGVQAELEKFDGFKHIDIAITSAKVNIEVDGGHHNYSGRQALADLKRTYYSFLKGYLTLRIPNALIKYHLDETADHIAEMLEINKIRITKSKFLFRR